jgi:hypothetical protein
MTALLVLGVVALAAAVVIVGLVIYNEAKGATSELHQEEPLAEEGEILG